MINEKGSVMAKMNCRHMRGCKKGKTKLKISPFVRERPTDRHPGRQADVEG